MFFRAVLDSKRHLEVLKTPGVIGILQNSKGPSLVPDKQIEKVRILEKHVGDCFHGKDLVIGDAVIVCDGPLSGLRGLIDKFDRKKLYIHLDAIPGSFMIEVEPHQVLLEKDSVYSLVNSR